MRARISCPNRLSPEARARAAISIVAPARTVPNARRRLRADWIALAVLIANAGARTSDDGVNASRTTWQSLDADLHVTHRAYLLLSAEWDRGDGMDARQLHAGLSWMF